MNIVVLGLGYVGAPLALELSKHHSVMGFDIDESRIAELSRGVDRTHEISSQALNQAALNLTANPSCLGQADLIIVTVPTPVDASHVPDLSLVLAASTLVARHLKQGATVVYESTVYPGVTEDLCIPQLEAISGRKHLIDFYVGYSPERINPGDKTNTLTTTTKIISGDCDKTTNLLEDVYGKVTKIYRAQSIKIAEAAKVMENVQRDVNIALVNELSQLLSKLDIDTADVLQAARSKWNFLDFRPGLVGGHCISVDPYYLTHKAAESGFTPKLILAARETNDSMPDFIVNKLLHKMTKHNLLHAETVVTILGVTFKENVPDIRNSKIIDIYKKLMALGLTVQVVDSVANASEVAHEYGVYLVPYTQAKKADAILFAVPHQDDAQLGWDLVSDLAKPAQTLVVFDLKATLDKTKVPQFVELMRP